MALDWILEHPEYHGDLESPEAMTAEYPVEHGRTNPFLHLSMHLAIAEQLSIDHPRGIRAAYQRLVGRGDAHQAAHEIKGMPGPGGMGGSTPGYAARQRRLHRADPPARRALEGKPPDRGLPGAAGTAYWRTPRSLSCAASQAATLRMSWSDSCAANAPMIGFLRTLAVAALPAAPRL